MTGPGPRADGSNPTRSEWRPRPGGETIALVGATASGKTALSLALAQVLNGEIISMDSRQVYRGMDIGTAKVTSEERGTIPHHGLDILDPDQSYSAGQFARDVRQWIGEIRGRGRVPILVGGTGFFLKSLAHPLFEEPDLDEKRVRLLRDHFSGWTRKELHDAGAVLDPERQTAIKAGGTQRAIRSLVVTLLTGRPLSWWHRNAPPPSDPIPLCVAWVHVPRPLLDERIATRVERMFSDGFVDEVKALLAAGYDRESPGMSGTGYRQVLDYLEGAQNLDSTKESIRIATRQYARRQDTWFKNQLDRDHLKLDATLPLSEQTAAVLAFCSERCLLHEGPR